MPYILPEKRPELEKLAEQISQILLKDFDNIEGNLNYTVSTIIDKCLQNKLNYKNANAIVGALECAKLEFYRRVVASYEDKKITSNGDAYTI